MVDRSQLIGSLLKIDDKERQVVPFKLNRTQRRFFARRGKRNIILKARQLGLSSCILADMFLEAITVPNTTCVVVSHETHATKRLLDRVHFFYDNLSHPRPEIGADSRTEISFPGLHSTIYIGTARSMTFGRGDKIDKAHLSELAFYEDGERIFNAIEDAVPMSGDITIETTPNGEDNLFYELWVRAREGKNSYKPFFFPWWVDNDYTMLADDPLSLPEDRGSLVYLADELELVNKFGMSEGQIRWRRWKIANKQGLFYQEFPEDEVTCFHQSGDPVFDPVLLAQMAQMCYDGIGNPEGWTTWYPPIEGMKYTIGADTSAGVPGGSYSAAVVVDEDYQVCATYQSRLDPTGFAHILSKLGHAYNDAELVIERNFTGYAVLGKLTAYPNIYLQRDFTTGKVTGQRGWWTTEQTKQFMLTTFRDTLPRLRIPDINLIRQARGYRYIKLRPTAQTFDDLLIALMLVCAVKRHVGEARGFVGVTTDWDW